MKRMIARIGMPSIMISVAAIATIVLSVIAVQQRTALHAVSTPRAIAAPAPSSSTRSLRARIAGDAEAMAVSLELADSPAPRGLIGISIEAVGPQPAIIAFAERIETRAPAARLANWRMAAGPGGIRLRGVVTAPARAGQ
jgi:hypothetical protein